MANWKNFAKATVSTGYDAAATSIVVTTGHGTKLPAAPFSATWWNSTDYADPSDDPNVEIVRVTAKATDTLTVIRGQEFISATTKNTSGKTYKLLAGLTAQTLSLDDTYYLSNYNASGSKTTTTGSITTGTSSLTVASASTFSVGHGIFIAGAGAAGAALVTTITAIAGTTITLANAAATTVATALVQHDDTVAIQTAINDICAVGTGTLKMALGFYRVNGPFQDTNSILKIPLNGVITAGPTKAIKIIGPPNPQPGWMGPPTEYGAVIQTDKVGATAESSILAAALFAQGDPNSGNGTAVYLESLIFRTYDNPQISGVDMGMAANFFARYVLIDAGNNFTQATEPTRQCFALRCATNSMTSSHVLDDVNVGNYWYGIIFSEECNFKKATASICKVGARADFGHHPTIGHLLLWACPTMLEVTGGSFLNLSLDYEEATGYWYGPLGGRDIYDPGDYAKGMITIHKTQMFSGATLPVEVTGGSGLNILSMNGLPARFRTGIDIAELTVPLLDVTESMRLADEAMLLRTLEFGPISSAATGFKDVRTPNSSGSAASLYADLIALWPLNEATGTTRNDSVGTSHLTDHNSVAKVTGPAPAGDWAEFVAASLQYLSVASNSTLQIDDSSITIAAWMRLASLPGGASGYGIVAKEADAPITTEYCLDFYGAAGGQFRFIVGSPTPVVVSTLGSLTPALDTRYLVLGYFDTTNSIVGIQINDDPEVIVSSGALAPVSTAGEFRIGSRPLAGFESYHHGRIGPVYIWKRVLTAGERALLYNGGEGISYPFVLREPLPAPELPKQ